VQRATGVLLVVALLVVPAGAAGASAGAPDGGSPGDAAAGKSTPGEPPGEPADGILVTRTVALDPEPGRIGVTVEYALPSSIRSFSTTLPAVSRGRATVVATDGLTRTGDGRYRWDGETDVPTLTATYAVPTDELDVGETSVDPGPWALVRAPSVSAEWRYAGTAPAYREELRVAGEGVAGDAMAFLGPATTSRRRVDGRTLSLVVPDAADPTSDPAAILATLAAADRSLGVRDGGGDRVVAFAMPDGTVDTAADGTSLGDDLWVDASRRAREGGHNLWRHEYAHTRQAYDADASMAWFDEGSACYFAHRLSLAAGDGGFETFRDGVTRDAALADDDGAVLADPDTWGDPVVEYTRGCRVLAALDARVRAASDGERDLADVLARMNARDGTITYPAFRRLVADVAGEPQDAWLDRHVVGAATPAVPEAPARFGVGGGGREDATVGDEAIDGDTPSGPGPAVAAATPAAVEESIRTDAADEDANAGGRSNDEAGGRSNDEAGGRANDEADVGGASAPRPATDVPGEPAGSESGDPDRPALGGLLALSLELVSRFVPAVGRLGARLPW